MGISARWRTGLLAGAGTIGVCAFAVPASAQINPPSADACAQDSTLAGCPQAPRNDVAPSTGNAAVTGGSQSQLSEPASSSTIVVTGTRIREPNLTSTQPITSITASNLLSTGNLSLGDALNQLPQLRASYSQSNSTRFIGTSGFNFLDLRGLGTSRTLVLVDGRRHVTSSPGDYLVDTNTIPDDLLERVDVVTGGSSAVYGSDAIAGVVNFVLKQNYEGFKVSGQGGISTYGDRGSYYGSVVYGKNFAEGRGNVAIAAEYSQQNALYNTERDFETGAYSGRSQFNLQENTGDPAALTDGIGNYGFYTGVRNGSISDGGELTAVCNATTLNNRAICRASSTTGFYVPQRYMFQPDGTLVMSNPTLDFRDITHSGSSNTVGGLGSTLENTGQLDPELKRFSVNLLAHYDVSPAFTPFIEAKYVRIRANQEGQPSFFQGSIPAFFGGGVDIRCTNPFLTAQALTTLQSIGRCTNPATGTIALSRFNVDFGGRGELEKRDTYRIVGGVRGDFFDNWHYDVSVNYGKFDGSTTSLNNLLLFNQAGTQTAGFLNAINAVRNSAGQIVCGINADNDPTNDDPACVPISVFGAGNATLTPAALRYINTTSFNAQKASEFDVTANLSGDSRKWFELPGGPLAFAVGLEYRRETASSVWDPLTASGATFLNAIAPFLPPALTSKEAYAEIDVPILKDLPFVQELSLSGAARASHYNTATGTVWSYNGGAVYAPIRDVKFRFNYSRAVRAPTQSDLYSSASQNFGFVNDPCDVLYRNTGTQYRDANCSAAGIPEGFVNDPARTQSLAYINGGNPNLHAETSDSYTAGVVLQPRFVPGLAISADYYTITVKNLISTLDAQTIINTCYDQASLNNPYCALVYRDPATHLFANPAVLAGPLNYARQKTSGIDADISYNKRFSNGDVFAVSSSVSVVFKRNNYLNVSDPSYYTQQLLNLGDPKWRAIANFDYKHGPVSLHYKLRYIGRQAIDDIADYISVDGRPAKQPEYTTQEFYPAVWYHDVKVTFDVADHYEFYVGADNVTNKLPPYGLLGTTDGSGIYDNVGRFLYAGFKITY